MKKIMTQVGLALALVGTLSLATLAQTPAPQTGTPERAAQGRSERHARKGRLGGRRFERRFERRALGSLNLSDAQRQQFKAIHERAGQGFQAQRQELRQLAEIRRNGGTWTPEQEARA